MPDVLSTSSATPVTLSGSPSVTATIQASGNCRIEVGCQTLTSGTNGSGQIDLYVDGNHVQPVLIVTLSATGEEPAFTAVTYESLTGLTLTPGSHTFTLTYSSTTTATFEQNYMSVTPL